MTNTQGLFGGRPVAFPALPSGEVIATYPTYPEAQQAVDRLVEVDGFPVQATAIVGNDMKSVERVTGRLSWGRAAGAGAISGFWLGLLLGIVTELFAPPTTGFTYVIGAVLIGAAFGMLFGLVSYALTRRRRDFSSVMQVVASSYSIVVPPDAANRARNTLGLTGSAAPVAAAADPEPEEPPVGGTPA